jgi:hypothetical protein
LIKSLETMVARDVALQTRPACYVSMTLHYIMQTLFVHTHWSIVLQALQAAQESVRVLPTVYKSWVRVGDAFKAIQRWVVHNRVAIR